MRVYSETRLTTSTMNGWVKSSDDRWQHVVQTVDPEKGVSFYKNGARWLSADEFTMNEQNLVTMSYDCFTDFQSQYGRCPLAWKSEELVSFTPTEQQLAIILLKYKRVPT